MNQWTEQALARLEAGRKEAKSMDQCAKVMAGPVAEALMSFCRQDGEFAQAVVQGGSFKDCMKAVAKRCGSALSDLEAYRRAVEFYFPGAQVDMALTIRVNGHDAPEPPAGTGEIALRLADFL